MMEENDTIVTANQQSYVHEEGRKVDVDRVRATVEDGTSDISSDVLHTPHEQKQLPGSVPTCCPCTRSFGTLPIPERQRIKLKLTCISSG
ncbi:hypothetical protein O3P69_000301 [Scylla paramamosain]|uniref:Uncharacterized protein n=1 Tax=Scylla paramamosain TaxID=85552 RepID=A0AAW0UVL0_SCYPA